MNITSHWIPRLIAGSAFALAAVSASTASATVLSFDDLAGGTVPVNYGGLDWSGAGWLTYDAPNFPYTPSSGASRATVGWYDDTEAAATRLAATVRFTTPGSFEGAWFAGLQGATVRYELFLGGSKVWTSQALDPSGVPTFLASGYTGLVDAVVFDGPALYSIAMDDFSFNAAPVPEPQSYALMLGGLGAIALASRQVSRRRSRA